MIQLVFTLDYEIFGNGQGSLKKHVYEPTKDIVKLFNMYDYKIVNFVEVAELIKISEYASDTYINNVESQILEMNNSGHEIALHIHPQWFDARLAENEWVLDYEEENLCKLGKEKIDKYLKVGIHYLKDILGESFQPRSFRAGGWMIQPSDDISEILYQNGIRVDSSVFKGGLSRYYGLDFRKARKNGYYWNFSNDVINEKKDGNLIEFPIYTKMVFPWKMISRNRINYSLVQNKSRNFKKKVLDIIDKARFKYPMKFDFTKMTFFEFKLFIDEIISDNLLNPETLKPIVLIGHSKNLPDIIEIEKMLSYIKDNNIQVTTFSGIIDQVDKLNV